MGIVFFPLTPFGIPHNGMSKPRSGQDGQTTIKGSSVQKGTIGLLNGIEMS